MSEQLKRCPFCGQKPRIDLCHLFGSLVRYQVTCWCGIKKWSEICLVDDDKDTLELRKQEAIEAWNRRAE